MPRRRPVILVLLTLLFSMAFATNPAFGAQGDPLTELAGAVADGRLDAAVLESMQSTGSADAIVVLDDSAVLQGSESRKRGRGIKDDDGFELSVKAQEFGRLKAGALASAGAGASTLQDYSAFATQFMHFENASALRNLLRNPQVGGVRANAFHSFEQAQSLPLIRQPEAVTAGHLGAGTAVAILDTGVDYTRAAFGSCTSPGLPAPACRVAFAADFAPQDNLLDAHGHGSNVAGISLGVAPATQILSLDVFDGGGAFTNDIIEALDWVVANKAAFNIVSANMSLGDSSRWLTTCDGTLNTPVSWAQSAFANVRAAGVLPVVAAGNGGTVTGQGFVNGLAMPACTAGAVSVGAVYDSNMGGIAWSVCTDSTTAADKITCFSQSAPILSLLAPGSQITAAGVTMSGTSMAAPHVAGAVAVIAGAAPGSTAAQREAALNSTGPNILDTRNGVTKHRLDVCAALVAAGVACGGPLPDNPVPAITSLSPASAVAGAAGFTLTINGSGFIAGSSVTFGGVAKAITLVNAAQLTIPVAAADIATPGSRTVAVTNGLPGGGTSSASFTVNAPVPALTSLSPAAVQAGSAQFLLTVNGSGFTAASVISFGGATQTTTFVSASQLRATIADSEVTAVGTRGVTVSTPAPGGGTSNTLTFTVTAAPPAGTVYLSLASGQTRGGVAIANEDIVRFDGGTTWVMVFDGSDVGLSSVGLDAFQVLTDGSILMSLTAQLSVAGIGTVNAADIIKFVPTSTGATTAGAFSLFMRGSTMGLTGSGDNTDAFFYDAALQRLHISTSGSFGVTGASGTDRDVFVCNGFVPVSSACTSRAIWFDGDDIGMSGGNEDIDALFIGADGTVYFSQRGTFTLTGGLTGNANDVVACNTPVTGATTSCATLTNAFNGNAAAISGNVTGYGRLP